MDYQKTVYKLGPKDFCKYFNDDKYFYPDLLKVSDLPVIGTCPWPAVIRLLIKTNCISFQEKMSLI